MFKIFMTMFSEADWLFFVLLSLAVIVPLCDMFIKTNGVAIVGSMLLTFATVVERCSSGENSANELLGYMFYIPFIVLSISWIVKITYFHFKKKNKIKYAEVDGNKIPLTKEGFLDYSFLIGEEGLVITDLKPTGKVRFDKGSFEVTSLKEYVYSGSTVVADRILNGKIIVKKK